MSRKTSPYSKRQCLCCGKDFMPKRINEYCIDKKHRNRYDYDQRKGMQSDKRNIINAINRNDRILDKFQQSIPASFLDVPLYVLRALGFDENFFVGEDDDKKMTFRHKFTPIKKSTVQYIRLWKTT